jgi:hypothetical protein
MEGTLSHHWIQGWVHQEVPNEEAAVETIGSPKDRSMDEELIIGYAETH